MCLITISTTESVSLVDKPMSTHACTFNEEHGGDSEHTMTLDITDLLGKFTGKVMTGATCEVENAQSF